MLERPDLPDQAISSALEQHYALQARALTFLPIGNDASSFVYRIDTDAGLSYFLKVKPGPVYEPAVHAPRFLNDQGLIQVVAPIPTRSNELSARIESFSLILYPFIEGRTGMDQGMTLAQWAEFGAVLRQVHAAQLPPGLAGVIQCEDFRPVWGGKTQDYSRIDQLARVLRDSGLKTPCERELASFWHQNEAEIQQIVDRCAQLAGKLRSRSLELVLCHTDIHTANILVDPRGDIHLIDWDHPKLAPREHDLFFIGGSLAGNPRPSLEENAFLQGYGQPPIDPLAMVFYHYVWCVQEIGDYAERVLATPPLGEETRAFSVRGFKQLFDPDDVIAGAYRAECALLHSCG